MGRPDRRRRGRARVGTLIGIATPVNRYDFAPSRDSPKPKFFIHGERDEICPLNEMRAFYAQAAEPKELVVIDAADHLFDGKVSEVADAVEDLLGGLAGTQARSTIMHEARHRFRRYGTARIGKADAEGRAVARALRDAARRAGRDHHCRGAAARAGARPGRRSTT